MTRPWRFLRASDKPLAMACLFDVTLAPPLLRTVPVLRRCIALFTRFPKPA